jgi:polyvinyl alcohol dehydrogenase (cytochrome)
MAFIGATLSAGLVAPAVSGEWVLPLGDLDGDRNAATETTIGPNNVAQLAPKWVLQTEGDNTATPVVHDGFVYFPDWGGKVWKVKADTGEVVWSRAVADYPGVPKEGAAASAGNTIRPNFSRTSPAFADGMIFLGDNWQAHLLAIDTETGDLKWVTRLDEHENAIMSGNPTVVGDRLYVGLSSSEQGRYAKDPSYVYTFRGSMVAVDIHTGKIVWRTYTMPENPPGTSDWAGGAIITTPSADVSRGTLYIVSDHLYSQPQSVTDCLIKARGDWDASCYPADYRQNSLIAMDLQTGEVKWSFLGSGLDAWEYACGSWPDYWSKEQRGSTEGARNCPLPGDMWNWAFAGGIATVMKVTIDGKVRDTVGVGQKTGIYWMFDADTGKPIWTRWVGPYSEPGGLQWGGSFDGERIYVALANLDHVPVELKSGELTKAGFWAALDPATGDILWETAAPDGAMAYGPTTVANGVVYAGTNAGPVDQMVALDAKTGTVLWRFTPGGSIVSAPAIVDGVLYWGSGNARFGGSGNKQFYAFSLGGK